NTPDVTANTPVVSAAITSAATAAMPATFAVPVVTLTPAPPNRHWNRRG
ncbi:MAG: hypothetical protein JOZ57_01565, partial [Abitibacteriaceae bacterium]|nr:hypothetical protein [Abditibacteriaceae bacterium]